MPDGPAKKRLTRRQLRNGVRLRGGSSHLLSVPPLMLLPFIEIAMHPSLTDPAIVVKKPYTKQERLPLVLKVTRRFNGEGTFTCDSKDVEFFTSKTGGTALELDGKDNVFDPKALKRGVTLFTEAKKAGIAKLKLELTGPRIKPTSVETKLFLVELTLDICEPRTSSSSDPPALSQPPASKPSGKAKDKFFGGRLLALQDAAKQQERAMLIVRPVKPASFKGRLTLARTSDHVDTYSDETFVKGKSSRSPDFFIDAASIPADGEKNFVEAVKAGESGYRLGLAGVTDEGDIVKVRCVEAEMVSNVEEKDLHLVARVPEKPERKSKSKFMPAPKIIGVKYKIELRTHLDKLKATAHKWSTKAGNITLDDDTKEVVKLEATGNSSTEDDIVLENLVTTEDGKLKLVQKMTAVTVEMNSVISGDSLTTADPINKITNPAAAVILSGSDASDDKKVPIYKITKITPALGLTDDDDRIAWWIVGGHGDYPGKAAFMNDEKAKRGLEIQVHGTARGDVLIQPYSGGFGFGMLRVHAIENHRVKFRVNRILFKGNPAATPPVPARLPTASIDDAKRHIALVNIYMRQAAIELVPDDSAEVASNAGNDKVGQASLDPRVVTVTKVANGFFDVEVDRANLVFATTANRAREAIRINCRNEVMSFAYVHSRDTGGSLATALLCPVNHAPKARKSPPRAYSTASYTLEDKGVPSSSLIPKTGLPGSTPVDPVKMIVLFPDVSWQGGSPATRDVNLLWGVIVPTQSIDNSAPAGGTARDLAYGNTLAHELGHVLGLGHRGSTGDPVTDGVALPAAENLMHPSNPPPTAQDVDIVQVKAIRFSEVLHRNP